MKIDDLIFEMKKCCDVQDDAVAGGHTIRMDHYVVTHETYRILVELRKHKKATLIDDKLRNDISNAYCHRSRTYTTTEFYTPFFQLAYLYMKEVPVNE